MMTDSLIVTQNGIRSISRLRDMIVFVQNDGKFSAERIAEFHVDEPTILPITLSKFDDGSMYIHDGHHRVVSIYLGGRKELDPSEYVVKHWESKDQYNTLNPDMGWYTPFDLESEVRLPNVFGFKNEAQTIKDINALRDFVINNRYRYCAPRTHVTVADLAGELQAKHVLV